MLRIVALSSLISSLVSVVLVLGITAATAQAPSAPSALPLGSAFAYQGRLESGGLPAEGSYDFRFTLHTALEGGNAVGTPITQTRTVTNGTITTTLDFGAGAFDGSPRFLSVEAKTTGQQDFVQLTPRQALTPAPYAVFAGSGPFWNLNGNSGTTNENFIGTTDFKPFEVRVNGEAALRVIPTLSEFPTIEPTPNFVAGFHRNAVLNDAMGATIGGGGREFFLEILQPNTVTGSFGTVSGGIGNTAGEAAFVGGGEENHATGSNAAIGGGSFNIASGSASNIGGGQENVAGGQFATISGGNGNVATGLTSFIGSGSGNTASGSKSTVADGSGNTASAEFSTVGGGFSNTASGYASTVAGGYLNLAKGDYSFAAGYRAKANSTGSFVWADSTPQDFNVSGTNAFITRAAGGYYLVLTTSPAGGFTKYCRLTAAIGSWECFSDREYKTIVKEADGRDVLAKLDTLPIDYWMATDVDEPSQHLGPMAQDFYAAFGLGDSERTISSIDLDGVALAAIKGLHEIAKDQEQRIESLTARLDATGAGTTSTLSPDPSRESFVSATNAVALALTLAAAILAVIASIAARRATTGREG